jgi:hypothetical protein
MLARRSVRLAVGCIALLPFPRETQGPLGFFPSREDEKFLG